MHTLMCTCSNTHTHIKNKGEKKRRALHLAQSLCWIDPLKFCVDPCAAAVTRTSEALTSQHSKWGKTGSEHYTRYLEDDFNLNESIFTCFRIIKWSIFYLVGPNFVTITLKQFICFCLGTSCLNKSVSVLVIQMFHTPKHSFQKWPARRYSFSFHFKPTDFRGLWFIIKESEHM